MPLFGDSEGLARKVAGFGLPTAGSNGGVSVDQDEWPDALVSFTRHRITGFAVAGMEAGWLELSADQAAQLLEAHRDAMLPPLVVERGLLEVGPAFEGAGVEFLVLKGPALAHTVYPDPAWRYFTDLDLLVAPKDWRRACEVLEDLGFRRGQPEPRPGFVERFGGAPSYHRSAGVEVDLHRTLVLGPFGLWVETDRLFEWTTEFRLGEKRFRRLDDASLLLHACIHASLGSMPPLTTPVRDVAQVAHFARVDWGAVAERSARWKLGSVVRHALGVAAESLRVTLPPEAGALLAGSSTRRERRALRAFVTERRGRGGIALSTIGAIKGARAKAAYIRGLLFPDKTFLAARQGGRVSYLSRWKVPVYWIRRGIARWFRRRDPRRRP